MAGTQQTTIPLDVLDDLTGWCEHRVFGYVGYFRGLCYPLRFWVTAAAHPRAYTAHSPLRQTAQLSANPGQGMGEVMG